LNDLEQLGQFTEMINDLFDLKIVFGDHHL
jgi:hypothetical protein